MGRVPVNTTLPPGDTQRERIVWLLLSADAVCSTTFLEEYIPRAAAVIHKLRKAGYTITTHSCRQRHGHSSPQIEYVLEALPKDPRGSHQGSTPHER